MRSLLHTAIVKQPEVFKIILDAFNDQLNELEEELKNDKNHISD